MSILIGLLIWVLTFMVLPVDVEMPVNATTIWFIVANYLALVTGFLLFRYKDKGAAIEKGLDIRKTLFFIIIVLLISFVFRYIDLLVIRDLAFDNSIKLNRELSYDNAPNSNLFFSLVSVLKSTYFLPIVIYIASKSKDRLILILSIILIVCPLPEALLLGTRKPFLELIVLFIITSAYFKNRNYKKFRIPLILGLLAALFLISGSILFKRVNEFIDKDKTTTHTAILDAKYNKFLKPNDYVSNYINDGNKSLMSKNILITAVHFGQYYTHGVFELNYLMTNVKHTTYGAYTFNPFFKFTDKLHLSKTDIKKVSEASPRKIVYLTAFGGLFIDFRWFSVAFMFLLGMFQKYVSTKSEKSSIWKGLFFYLLIINVFLCVLNYMRGSGVYPVVGFFIILMLLKLFHSKLNEESPNT